MKDHEGVVNVFREARDLCIEGDDNSVDLVTEETDCFDDDINSVVCADSIALSSTYALPEEVVSVHRRGWNCN